MRADLEQPNPPPPPPPLDIGNPKTPLYSISFATRLEQIRKEVESEIEVKTHIPESQGKWRKLRRFIPIVIVMLWLGISAFMFTNPQAGRSVFVLSDVRVTGPIDLCPGETLDFEFDVTVKETGTYNLWMSTWKTEPPPSTIIFSEVQPFVIGSERSFPVTRKWLVPTIYEDPADSERKPMIPGTYIRDISVTAEGRNTSNRPLQVVFRIREGCKDQ